jgi:ABC-type microcin C transport system permease subunit YejB
MEFNFANPSSSSPANSNKPEDSPKGSMNKKVIILLLILLLIVGIGVYFLFFAEGGSLDSSKVAVKNSTASTAENKTGNSAATNSLAQKDSLDTSQNEIKGVNIGGLFIPYGFNEEAIKFLQKLKSQGKFPIFVDENTLGKTNPF